MSLQVIVRDDDAGMAAHVDGAVVKTHWKTFVIDAPELEAFLKQELPSLIQRQVVGVEIHRGDPAKP